MVGDLHRLGWVRFGGDPGTARWAAKAREAAGRAVSDPGFDRWHVCQNTWFVGVDALDNDEQGRVDGSGPLVGPAIDFVRREFGAIPPLHKGQVSAVYPGYPKPREGESEAAFRYRLRRDAAHLDGVKPTGPDRRRRIEEPHAFILGLPLTETDPGAAPLVVWDGSHEVMRAALLSELAGHDPEHWGRVDITEAYRQARQQVFEHSPRRILHAGPGEAYLLHRLALHGIAPWGPGARAPKDGRVIAYFRPPWQGSVESWLRQP